MPFENAYNVTEPTNSHFDPPAAENPYDTSGDSNPPPSGYGVIGAGDSESHAQTDVAEAAKDEDEVPVQPNPKGLDVADMLRKYIGEQENAKFRSDDPFFGTTYDPHARTPGARFDQAKTNYLRPEQQAAATVGVKDGKLMRGGAPLDTRGASGVGTAGNSGEGKHIFAMTPDEQVRSIDPWANHTEERNDNAERSHTLGFVNHSSLAARQAKSGKMVPGQVAAAGELTAEDGKLTQVSDSSGHYEPDNKMTYQALKHFEDEKVEMHDVAVRLTGKEKGQQRLIASAREFMGHEGSEDAEAHMRLQRKEMGTEIKDARKAFKARQADGKMRYASQDVASTAAKRDPRSKAPLLKRSQDLIGLFEGLY